MWVTRIVDAPTAHVWRVLVDTTTWTRWGPSFAEVDHVGRFLGPGSTGRIRTPLGVWLQFHVTEFEEGRRWSWTVAGIAATSHRVESLDAHRCRVGFEVPLFAAPYVLVCGIALQRIDRLACDRAGARIRPLP